MSIDPKQLPVISLFSGALGLDLGLEKAGFETRVAVEHNQSAAEMIRLNRPDIPVIQKDIEKVTTEEILDLAGLKPGEPIVVSGGPSCQTFSTAGKRGSLSDPRGVLFKEFLRVVRESKPRFFIMENVKGILSAAFKHRPLIERGPGYPPLETDEILGSALIHILDYFRSSGYYVIFDLLNAADFGVPQSRERVLFIGSRDGEQISMPDPTHAQNPLNGQYKWRTLREGLRNLGDPNPIYRELISSKRKYLELIPEGKNWRALPLNMQDQALGGAAKSWGGRGGFLRRLAWNRTPPTITTSPDSKATMICHPTELRPLSVRECATLQQFPSDWQFVGSVTSQYAQIGNAVPVGLGAAIGLGLREVITNARANVYEAGVTSHNKDLILKLAKREPTRLNPPRMRKVKSAEATKAWMAECRHNQPNILEHIDYLDDYEDKREVFISASAPILQT